MQLTPPERDAIVAAAENLRGAINGFVQLRGTDADRTERLAGLFEASVDLHDQHGASPMMTSTSVRPH